MIVSSRYFIIVNVLPVKVDLNATKIFYDVAVFVHRHGLF